MRLLAFEDEDQAGEFCQHHGLSVQDQSVVLDRAMWIDPETAFPTKRAQVVIESKQARIDFSINVTLFVIISLI